jgi:hypothetical protein
MKLKKNKPQTFKYQSVNEVPELTTLAESKGLKLVQAFDCSSKKKSYILIPGAGEPGLLYTDDVKQLAKYLEDYATTKLGSVGKATAEESENTESSQEEGETTEEDDADFEE